MSEVKTGDWVLCKSKFTTFVGYVKATSPILNESLVTIVRTLSGSPVYKKIVLPNSQLEPYLTSLEKDDLYQMMDLALDMKDEEWFNELQEQLPKELPF